MTDIGIELKWDQVTATNFKPTRTAGYAWHYRLAIGNTMLNHPRANA